MKKLFILLSLCLCLYSMQTSAQYDYTLDVSAEVLAERLQGEGVIILNPVLRCSDSSNAVYQGMGELGIDTGIVISNTNMAKVFRPYSDDLYLRPNGYYSMPEVLDSSIRVNYFHPLMDSWNRPLGVKAPVTCALEMDIVTKEQSINFNYVLGDMLLDSIPHMWSQNWITSPYCHCFLHTNIIGIFISGGDYEDTVNYAVYPQEEDVRTGVPVNRYSLRLTQDMFDEMCSSSDTDTMLWGGTPRSEYIRYNTGGYRIPDVNFPGLTQVMDVSIPVTPCDTHRLVIAVGRVSSPAMPDGTVCQLSQQSGSAMFIGKISSSGEDSCTTLGMNSSPLRSMGIQLYPNPFSHHLTFTSAYPHKSYKIQIVDVMGRTLYTVEGNAENIQKALNDDIIHALPVEQWYFYVIIDMESGKFMTEKLRKE